MIKIDGKEIDLTNPATWGNKVQLNSTDSKIIVQNKEGVVVVTPKEGDK